MDAPPELAPMNSTTRGIVAFTSAHLDGNDVTNPLAAVPDRIAFAGDWHANTCWAPAAIKHAARHGADILIHTGDFGYTFPADYLLAVSGAALYHRLPVLFIDGNHDDPEWLAARPLDEHGLRPVAPGVWHLPRGHRWTWNGIRFLALGGAYSVDRSLRVARGYHWWPGESLTEADLYHAIGPGHADIMITHDAPDNLTIPGLDPAGFDPADLAAAAAHRRLLRTAITRHIQPAMLWHGHYHVRYTSHLHLDDGRWCRVTGLDRDDTTLDGNIDIVQIKYLAAVTAVSRLTGWPGT